LSPTKSPTVMPTFSTESYFVKEVIEQVTVVTAEVTLQVKSADAENPVMVQAVQGGVARALGLDADLVTITHINDAAVSSRRLLESSASASVKFQVESASTDTDEVERLESNIKEAAVSGAMIANIKSEASAKGVLTQELKDMPLELPEPALEDSTKQVVKKTQVLRPLPTSTPTQSPTAWWNKPGPILQPCNDESGGCTTSDEPCYPTGWSVYHNCAHPTVLTNANQTVYYRKK